MYPRLLKLLIPTFRDIFKIEKVDLALFRYQRNVHIVMTDGDRSDLAVGPSPVDLSHNPSDGEIYQV
jgi:hypothetical protein